MERSILFVSEQQSFLVKAMQKSLMEAGFTVRPAQPDIVEIQLMQNLPDIFFVYLEGNLIAFNGTLKYLKSLITEEGKDRVLYLIGNPAEIESACAIIPRTLVSATFIRPVMMKDVINKLNSLLMDEDAFSGRKRILVVDDDEIMLRTMKNWLSAKYDVFMANSGMNAISFLAKNHADLILLDYEMPVASGLQVFEMLKAEENTKHIPVIFLTSKDDKDTVMKVIAAKPEKYLLKTMAPELLVKNIDDFFRGK